LEVDQVNETTTKEGSQEDPAPIPLLSSPPVNGQDGLRKNPRATILPCVSLLKNNKILFIIFKIN
jgi:hypothetical protein